MTTPRWLLRIFHPILWMRYRDALSKRLYSWRMAHPDAFRRWVKNKGRATLDSGNGPLPYR